MANLRGQDSKMATMVLKIYPNFGRGYYERAQHYEHLGKYDKAYEDYTKSLQLEDKRHHIRYQRARVAARLGRFMDAVEDFN